MCSQPIATAHTFIVRLWMEDSIEPGVGRWRGHVTHLIDERRIYVDTLDDVVAFIGGYLVPDGHGWRLNDRPRAASD
jgi:hypothetical protein